MSREVWPFRRPLSESVELSPWIMPDAENRELPEYLEGWDSQTDIRIERSVCCDPTEVLKQAGLAPDTPVVLSISWNNRQSFMSESVYRDGLRAEQIVEVTLPAARLGGSLMLRTSIAVATSDPMRPLGTARWAGSVLFDHEQVLTLEGSGPMFPMTETDFSGTRYHPEASWALELPDDLGLPVLGTVLLLINTRDDDLLRALGAPVPDARQIGLLQELEQQVSAFFIRQAASRRSEIDSEEWEEQSVGALLAGYLRIADEQQVVTAMRVGEATTINAAIQGAVRAEGFGRRFS